MLNLLLSSAVILLVTMLIYLFMLHAYIFLLSLIEVTLQVNCAQLCTTATKTNSPAGMYHHSLVYSIAKDCTWLQKVANYYGDCFCDEKKLESKI